MIRFRFRFWLCVAFALAFAACSKSPPLSLAAPDLDSELEALQGKWLRGDTECEITIEDAQFLESCPDHERLLYGDKWYSITFPRLGTVRLTEGGSYHEYGYARDGADIYIGAGGAGVARDDEMIAVPFRTKIALVANGERCTRRDLEELDAEGTAIGCAVGRDQGRLRVRFEIEGAPSFVQSGRVALSDAVALGKLRRR